MNGGTARAVMMLARYGLPAVVGLYYLAALQGISYSPDGAYRGYVAAMELHAGTTPPVAGSAMPSPLWVYFLVSSAALGLELLLSSKILSLVFCCLALLGMYLFAAALIGDRITALLATLVAAVDPWMLQAGPSGTATGLAVALSVGSLFFAARRDVALASLFAGLATAVFWQGVVLLLVIGGVIALEYGFSRAWGRRVAGSLALFLAALFPWAILVLVRDLPPIPDCVTGEEPLAIPAGRWALLLSGAAAAVMAGLSRTAPQGSDRPVRSRAANRLPYWGWVIWLALSAWVWDPWLLIVAVPPLVTLSYDAVASLIVARAAGAGRYLVGVVAITALLVALQQVLFHGWTRPAMAASVERGEETALASAWTRALIRPSLRVEAEPRWQVSLSLGRRVDPVGDTGGSDADIVLRAGTPPPGYREAYRPLPGPSSGGGPRLAVYVKQKDARP